jgi:hypothetical protein
MSKSDSVCPYGHKLGLPLPFTAIGVVYDDPPSRISVRQ